MLRTLSLIPILLLTVQFIISLSEHQPLRLAPAQLLAGQGNYSVNTSRGIREHLLHMLNVTGTALA